MRALVFRGLPVYWPMVGSLALVARVIKLSVVVKKRPKMRVVSTLLASAVLRPKIIPLYSRLSCVFDSRSPSSDFALV